MALSRNKIKEILSAAGVDGDHMDTAVQAIIDGHTATVDSLKEDRDNYKKEAEKLPEMQKELEDLKASKDGDLKYKDKYEKEHSDFEAYKSEQTAKETMARKTEAYRELLKEAGISERHLKSVLKTVDIDSVELDDDGRIKDSKEKVEAIKNEWSDLITTTGTQGASTATPPEGSGNNGNHGSGYAKARAQQYYERRYGVPEQNGGNE